MKIHIIHTGEVYIDQALAYKEKSFHPAPFTGWGRPKSKKIWVPVSAYLIEHPKGNILIDAGWSEEIREKPKEHLGFLAHSMFQGRLPKGESIAEQLHKLNFKSSDIDFVLLTHLHADHVSGIHHLKHAKKILTSEIEWKAAHKQVAYNKSMWKGIDIRTFSFTDIPYGPFQQGIDFFEDGSLYLIYTPGHASGMFSVMVKVQDKWILLASDVGYGEQSWKKMILPGLTTNSKKAKRSLKWVQNFSKQQYCHKIIANHDPSIKSGIIDIEER